LIGHSTYNWLLKYLSATLVAVVTLAEPIGAAILAYFFLQEIPTVFVIIGGLFILSGIYISSRESE
jgi:drug/metabolite transporter (DMT)-like permease